MLAQHRQQSLLHRRDVWLTLTGNIPIAAIEQNKRPHKKVQTARVFKGFGATGAWRMGRKEPVPGGRPFQGLGVACMMLRCAFVTESGVHL